MPLILNSMKRLILIIALLIVTLGLRAQQAQTGVAGGHLLPSDKQVIVIVNSPEPGTKSLNIFRKYKSYEITKDQSGTGNFKKQVTITFPTSYAEFKKRTGASLADEFKIQVKAKDDAEAWAILQSGDVQKLGYFFLSKEFLEGIGMLWPDTDIKGNSTATAYRISGIDTTGKLQVIYTQAISEVKRVPFPRFKLNRALVADSVVQFTWSVPLPAVNPAVFAAVYRKPSTSKNFTIAAERLLVYNRDDSLHVYFTERVKPGELLTYYVQPFDMAGNKGAGSDPTSHLAKSFKSIATITGFKVKDTTNALYLSWNPLPRQAIYSGIQVLKSRSAQKDFVVADTLSPNAVNYLDRKVLPNMVYYYQVRPLLVPYPGFKMLPTATAHGSLQVKKERPSKPGGLTAKQDSTRFIVLTWDKNPELDLFAYYVLRGTSDKDMRIISPPVRDTVYRDSLKYLNGETQYVYAVQVMNLAQNMSDISVPVGIRPLKAQYVASPAGVQSRWADRGVSLKWENTVAVYDNVIGYIVFRREKGEPLFKVISKVQRLPFFRDTIVMPGKTYEYGITSVDAFANQSLLSPLTELMIPTNDFIAPPSDLYLSNKAEGVQLNWPRNDQGNHYVIYRRPVSSKTFSKVAAVENASTYLDKTTQPNVLYIYKISAMLGQTESKAGQEKAVRRLK
jgi:fibronectin type 3 domain-containing protein